MCPPNVIPPRLARVYVAGPLNAMAIDYINNCRSMMQAADELRVMGYSVYVPCLDLLMGLAVRNEWDYEDYFGNSQPWLMAADAVYLCPGWEDSKGTRREKALADQLGIPTFTSTRELFVKISSPI